MSESSSRSGGRGPSAVPAAVLFFGLLIVVVAILAFSVRLLDSGLAAASESAYTQAHGVPGAATVLGVTSNGRDSGTENVTAAPADPVDGQQLTTVHVPSTQSFPPSASVRILIDPQDPGYAELPGHRFTTASNAWWTAASFWLMAALVMVPMIFVARGWIRERRGGALLPAATGSALPVGYGRFQDRNRCDLRWS